MTLADLDRGASAVVNDVAGPRDLAVRLLEMGLTKGTTLRVIRRAPLRDPIEVEVRGYRLTLRRDEASLVQLVPSDAGATS